MPNAGVCFKVLKKVKKAQRHKGTKAHNYKSFRVSKCQSIYKGKEGTE